MVPVNGGVQTRQGTLMDIRYAARFNVLNARFYGHLRHAFAFVNLFMGSAAVAGVLLKDPSWVAFAGIALAALSITDHLVGPAERAITFKERAKRYAELEARAREFDDEALYSALLLLRADAIDGIEALGVSAYNDTMATYGYPGREPMSRMNRLLAMLA